MRVKTVTFLIVTGLLILLLVFLAGVYTGSRSGDAREQELQREREELRASLTGIQDRNSQLERSLAEEIDRGNRIQKALGETEQRLRGLLSGAITGHTELQERFSSLTAETERGLQLGNLAEVRITEILRRNATTREEY